jgi:hypothetical protein
MSQVVELLGKTDPNNIPLQTVFIKSMSNVLHTFAVE